MSDSLLFPSIESLVSNFDIFLVTGPLGVAACLVLAWRWARRRHRLEIKHLAIAVGLLTITLGHTMAYKGVFTALAFRRLPMRDIRALEIEALDGAFSGRGVLLRILDQSAITDGLRLLPAATAYQPEHEHSLDGYRIRFVTAGGSRGTDYYLSVYCGTQRIERPAEKAAIVVPHRDYSPDAWGRGGTYQSWQFVEWLTDRLRQADPRYVFPSCG